MSDERPAAAGAPMDRLRARIRSARSRWPAVDHAVRAADRNSEVAGSQVAGAVTYFGFLSFFPLLALAFSAVGYVSAVYPGAQDAVTRAVEDAFPSLIGSGPGQIDVQDVIGAKEGAGLVGVGGLLYSGLGWLDALRDGLRRVFGTSAVKIGFLRKKLVDVFVLVLLGGSVLASLAVSSAATAATDFVLGLVGLSGSVVATVLLKALSVAVALLVDTVLFAILLSRLSGARLPWTKVRSGALFGAVGFEVLKLLGTFLVGRTTANPLYATFGVVVGLLVWINLVSKLLVFAAAWTVTGPYSLEPGSLEERGAGRSTGLAAATEPVAVVAPPDYEQRPVGPVRPVRPVGAGAGVRRTVLAAVAGAGAALLLRARHRRR
jgi:membrane protein